MKVAKIQSSKGFRVANNKSLGIQNYDYGNDYPQKVDEIVRASGTGLSCVRTYSKFINGRGFAGEAERVDAGRSETVVNKRGHTLNYVLRQASSDYALHHGFALHVNYNALCRIAEIAHIPFEHCRFEARDKETRQFSRIAVYDDWTGRDPDRKSVKKGDIDFIDMFNPAPEVIAAQVEAAGGWAAYKGQVYYFSGDGDREYPAPIFEAELTNMRSEEGLDNVVGRNITCNFLPGAMLVDINNEPQSEAQFQELQNEMKKFQGDENAGNIFMVQVGSEAEMPRKVDLQGENYDKAFESSEKYLPDAIGRTFIQPPILRAQDVGANFGADLMVNAYKFYNAQTEGERSDVSGVFAKIFASWGAPGELVDATIAPLSYDVGASRAAEMGRDVTNDMVAVISNPALSAAQKIQILTGVYGLPEVEAAKYVIP